MTMINLPRTHLAGMAVYVLFVCWLIFGWGGPQVTTIVGSLGFVAFSAFACACTAVAARAGRGSIRIGLQW